MWDFPTIYILICVPPNPIVASFYDQNLKSFPSQCIADTGGWCETYSHTTL